jgi:hypothetical protein
MTETSKEKSTLLPTSRTAIKALWQIGWRLTQRFRFVFEAFRPSDWEIPNCQVIRDGVPALNAART